MILVKSKGAKGGGYLVTWPLMTTTWKALRPPLAPRGSEACSSSTYESEITALSIHSDRPDQKRRGSLGPRFNRERCTLQTYFPALSCLAFDKPQFFLTSQPPKISGREGSWSNVKAEPILNTLRVPRQLMTKPPYAALRQQRTASNAFSPLSTTLFFT